MANNLNINRRRNLRYKSLRVPELCGIIKTSVLTEKSVILEENYNTVILKVIKSATKPMIKLAMEAIFKGVKVLDVRVLNYKPITKTFRGKKYMSNLEKRAYIRLTKDSVIELGEDQTSITQFTGKNKKEKTKEENV